MVILDNKLKLIKTLRKFKKIRKIFSIFKWWYLKFIAAQKILIKILHKFHFKIEILLKYLDILLLLHGIIQSQR